MNPVFRTLKARKAKFGFQTHISANTFIAIADAVKEAQRVDPELLFEVDTNYGNAQVKVYTNVETAAHIIGAATIK